ncbi:Hypothetical predicted protein [Octopus vulgaris]|uniref:Uncharacterized protein n=1 Tax=Octopus vulgaris TaxID=6645 RepID=A0AA36AKF1_OCTVU|nr:Hypothetical predicted protein [Octopus vulgaris]
MDIDSHVTHRKNSENDLVWRHNRKLSLEINRIQSIQNVLVKNMDKKMNTVQREIKSFGYSEEKKKNIAAEKFPIYLPFWKEWKFSGLKRQTDVSPNKEINISKINKTNSSLKDKIRSFIQNMSRGEDKPFIKSELVAQDISQGETNEQLLSVNPGAVGMDSNTASEVTVQEKLAALGATDDDKQAENINKKTDDTFENKPNESIRRTSSITLSSWGQSTVALQSQVNSNTLISVLPSIYPLDKELVGSTTQESDRFCPEITKKTFYTSEFNLHDITKNQHIIQSDNNTASSVNDMMASKKNTQRRSSIAVSPRELNVLLKKELKIKENGHLSQASNQTTMRTRRHSVLPNLDKFYEARQSDDNVFRVSQSLRFETDVSDIHKGNKKSEYKTRKSLTKAPVLDREIYNADGSLRAIYCLPSLEESWKQARRARYIRSKSSNDKRLSIEEIFSASDNDDIEESDTNTES